MPSRPSLSKKRGRPSKYESAEQKKKKYADECRQARQSTAAAKCKAQFAAFYPPLADQPLSESSLRPEHEPATISNKLDTLLPLDDPVLLPGHVAFEATRTASLAPVEDAEAPEDSEGFSSLLLHGSEQTETGGGT
ncbi:uncharacterized protein BDW70DRAFT_165100 [Aspergillus foveolatus]|uniref:uncharacterized protein n=1 Tax=Aspergillus foveolatus TaxID=210207 RepID=UPI003CCC946A